MVTIIGRRAFRPLVVASAFSLLSLAEFSLMAEAADEQTDALIDATLAIEGDVDYGLYLAGECLTCHQLSGAHKGIPSVVGWPREDFVRALVEYKTKTRPHDVMQTVTSSLGSEEIAGLAAYFEAAAGEP